MSNLKVNGGNKLDHGSQTKTEWRDTFDRNNAPRVRVSLKRQPRQGELLGQGLNSDKIHFFSLFGIKNQ